MKKKADISKNPEDFAQVIARAKKQEKKKHPLRIDDKTTILVVKKNCNKSYASKYIEKVNNSRNNHQFK